MSTPRLLILFVVGFALALVATAPLSLALGGDALAARRSEGTVWAGRLEGAALGPLALGDVEAGLDPLRLLTGKTSVRLEATGGAATGRGRVTLGGKALSVETLSGSAPLSLLGAPPPFDGVLRLKDVDAAFAGSLCKRAAGEISAELTGLGDSPLPLGGKPDCRGAALALPLAGSRDGVGVSVLLTLQQNGAYRADTQVTTDDAGLGAMLAGAGFARDGDAYARMTEGRLQ